MITHVDPYNAIVANTSRNDAVNVIRDIIREAGGDLNDYNIEAIADEVLASQGGALSVLPYGDPEVYATAMGLRLEVMPMGE